MKLDVSQQAAFDAIVEFFTAGGEQTLSLGGYAGTGKTTLIRALLDRFPDTAVATFTGRAAYTLHRKGVDCAQTIHSLLYEFRASSGELGTVYSKRLRDMLETNPQRVIIDEASMVPPELVQDLLHFRLPVLWVGDHGQLHPVSESQKGANVVKDPELKLHQIHRQAAQSEIILLAHHLRDGGLPQDWKPKTDEVQLFAPGECDWKTIAQEVDVVLTGTNRHRQTVNDALRKVHGFEGFDLPQPGEMLLVQRNCPTQRLFNGQTVLVVSAYWETEDRFALHYCTDDGRHGAVGARFTPKKYPNRKLLLVDYGYALTCHKAQGSEWDSALVLEGYFDDPRWRYTAVTRAAKKLYYEYTIPPPPPLPPTPVSAATKDRVMARLRRNR